MSEMLFTSESVTEVRIIWFVAKSPPFNCSIEAFESPEYKELSKLRWANSTETNIIIMDGSVTH